MTEPRVYFSEPLNDPAEIPSELDRWNWGAFLLNWIWGIGNSVWIALLMFVPLVNIVMVFVLGARGSRWAWKNRAWRDAQHFRTTQRRWAIAGITVWLMATAASVGLFYVVFAMLRSGEPYQMTMSAAAADTRVADVLGEDYKPSFFFTGNVQTNADGSGYAAYNIPMAGNKAEGQVVSRLYRTNGRWEIERMVLVMPGRQPLFLIYPDRKNNSPEQGDLI